MPCQPVPTANITVLLRAWAAGDRAALDQLTPLVYEVLHRRAAAYMKHERPGNVLQPTALIHEVYLQLAKQNRARWENRAQFFGVAAQIMRRILVDQARSRNKAKRSGRWVKLPLDEASASHDPERIDVLALHQALERLAALDPRKSKIAELRFFAGLTSEETASVVGVSVATVERDWQAARAYLYAALRCNKS